MPKSLPNSTVKVKRATAARWASQNPVLAAGEIGYETDTRKMKLGDGTSSWTQLSYLVADGTGAGGGSGGQAATIRIGTVTTLRYNQNATVRRLSWISGFPVARASTNMPWKAATKGRSRSSASSLKTCWQSRTGTRWNTDGGCVCG